MSETKEELKSANQTARLLGVSTPTLCRLMQSKKIGFYRVGKRVLFAERHVAEFLEACESKPVEGSNFEISKSKTGKPQKEMR